MCDINRYSLSGGELEFDSLGGWVRFSDHLSTISTLTRERDEARDKLEAIEKVCPDSEWTHERCMDALEEINRLARQGESP